MDTGLHGWGRAGRKGIGNKGAGFRHELALIGHEFWRGKFYRSQRRERRTTDPDSESGPNKVRILHEDTKISDVAKTGTFS